MARLEYIDNAGQPATIVVGPQHRRVTVGRNPESDISTTNPSVSRNHGEILLRGGVYLLKDNDSSNGTMLNGGVARPHKLLVLQHGDIVTCGEFELRFFDDGQDELYLPPVAVEPPPPEPLPARRRPAPSEAPPPVYAPPDPYAASDTGFADAAVGDAGPARRARRPAPRDPEVALPPSVPVAPPPPVAPVPVVDTAELIRLRSRVVELETMLQDYANQGGADMAALEGERQKLEGQLEARTIALDEAQATASDLKQKLSDLEAKLRRQDSDIENYVDKQTDLKENIAHQASQIAELRRELNERDHELEDLRTELRQAETKRKEIEQQQGGREKEINNLKAEFSSKSRMIDELQRQLDITTYDLQQAQEHLSRVTSEFSGTGGEVDALKRKISDLKAIMDDKDQRLQEKEEELRDAQEELEILREEDQGGTSDKLKQLQTELGRLRQENAGLAGDLETAREDLEKAQAAPRGGASPELVNQLKRDNRDLRRQIEDLETQLASGGGGGAKAGGDSSAQVAQLQRQIEDLEAENELLNERIAKMSRRGGGGEAEAEAVRELKAENRKLRQQLEEAEERAAAAAQAPAPSGGGLGKEVVGDLKELYEKFNALSAKVTGDMDTAAFSAAELKRVVELLDRMDLSGLNDRDKRKLEILLRDVNPRETLDTMEQMMNSSMEAAKGARTDLRKMRELLEV